MSEHTIAVERQRRRLRARGRRAAPARPLHPRRPRPDRHAHRLRHRQLRRLHRASSTGRLVKSCMLLAVQADGAKIDDGRGARRGRRADAAAAVVLRAPRAPVRLLHAGDADERDRAARAEPAPDRGGDHEGDPGQHLPLHRLREHRRGRGRHRSGRRVRELDDHHRPRRPTEGTELEKGLDRPVDPAQGGQAARPGPGDLLRRRQAARDGLRPLRPLAVRAREDRLDRRLEGARARRRLRDAHGRRGRDPHRPVLRDVRRAGRRHQGLRARGRQGAAHGRAGRRGLRGDPRARARRGRAGRGRVRAARRARRRARGGQGRDRHARRRRLERRLERRLRLGRRRHRARRGRPRREDRQAPLPPLLVDAARVRGRARGVRPRHRAVDDHCNHQMPGVGAIWMAPALRVGIDKLRFVTQDIGGGFGNKICLAPAARRAAACSRGSSTGRCSGPSGAPTSTRRTRTATSAGSSTSRSR